MTKALIIVDVQRDFLPGGALEVPQGDQVIKVIEMFVRGSQWAVVVATGDWHPANHSSFETEGGPWPVHCVEGTPGAEVDERILALKPDTRIYKGRGRNNDGYSAFEVPHLVQVLRDNGVHEVHVVGLALDYCVKATALDAARLGFETIVHRTACRAVGPGLPAVNEMRNAGVKVVS